MSNKDIKFALGEMSDMIGHIHTREELEEVEKSLRNFGNSDKELSNDKISSNSIVGKIYSKVNDFQEFTQDNQNKENIDKAINHVITYCLNRKNSFSRDEQAINDNLESMSMNSRDEEELIH